MSRLIDVYLHGPLAERFGDHHRFAINNPQEAVAAMDANFPGFVPAFLEHERYAIYADGDWRDVEGAELMPVSRELHFCPMIEGRAFLGAALVGMLIPALAGTMAATIIGGLLMTGLLIGIALLFRKKPPKKEEEARDESFIFSGPENVTGQGVAVPLIYGRVFAGSVVISAGQDVSQLMTTTAAKAPAKPVSPNTNKPQGRDAIKEQPPPTNVYKGGHGRSLSSMAASRMSRDMLRSGAGVTPFDDPPPDEGDIPEYEEGWPDIIADPVYGWRPNKGWVIALEQRQTEEDDVNRKALITWQPPYITPTDAGDHTVDPTTGEVITYGTSEFSTYNWNMNRGFFMDDIGKAAEEWELTDGAELETPIEDPSE